MKEHEGCIRGYHRSTKAFYANVMGDRIDVMIGMYHPEGGTSGEFKIEWEQLDGKRTPRLKSFDDSWNVLWMFKDLLEKMANIDSEDISEEDFCKLLDSLKIKDLTDYDEPTGNIIELVQKDFSDNVIKANPDLKNQLINGNGRITINTYYIADN